MSLGLPSDLHPALAPILNTVLDAVVVMSEDGRITGWNGVAEQIFGWRQDEAIGKLMSELVVPHQHRVAHEEGLRRLNDGGAPRVLNRRIEISALRKDGTEIPVELSITTAASGAGRCFVGFLRDISDRRAAEERLKRQALETRLMFEIAHMAAESESFEAALERALKAICEITGWPVGHAFIAPESGEGALISTAIWVEADEGVADELKAATAATSFAPGVGLPGKILQSGEPMWISDTDKDVEFPRKGKGFRGAFGFPLKREGKLIAILEFFAQTAQAPDPALLMTVRTLGEQVGRVFERKRTQDRQQLLRNELNHRVKNILSVVQAIAHQTFKNATDVGEANTAFTSRLLALSGAQNLLVSGDWRGASLADIVEAALTGCGGAGERFRISGPRIEISATNAVAISLAVHEMCTNAFKYGALSVEGGEVRITWGEEECDEGRQFFFEWREIGGPPVTAPLRKGFGTSLIERGLASELGGKVHMNYEPTGLVCRFTAAINRA